MKNTLLKTALVLSVDLCAVNLYGGEIGKSPKVYFQTDISKVEPFAKPLNFRLTPPPEERKKVVQSDKRKTSLKKKKRKIKKELKEYVTILGIYFGALTFTMLLLSVLLPIGGIVVFAVGVSLFNPLMWIIGLVSIFLGLLLLLILNFMLYEAGLAVVSVIWYAAFVLTGITLFIVGLVLGIMSLWIGGIVFFAAIVLFFLIGILTLMLN